MMLINILFLFLISNNPAVQVWRITNIYGLTVRDLQLEEADSIHITDCINSHHNIGLMLNNRTNRTTSIKFTINDLEEENRSRISDAVSIFDCQLIEARDNRNIYDPLMPIGDTAIVLQGKTSKFIWLKFSSQDFQAGSYSSVICLQDAETAGVYTNIKLTLDILPVTLSEANPLSVQIWSYLDAPTIGIYKEQAVADLHSHGVNVYVLPYYLLPKYDFHAEQRMAANFDKLDSTITLLKYHGMYLIWLGLEFPEIRESRDLRFMTAQWKSSFRKWYQALLSHLLEILGDYSKFAIYPIDEGHHEAIKILDRVVPFLKEVDSRAQLYFNPGEELRLGDLTFAAPYIDIWQPHITLLKDPQVLAMLKSLRKPIWTYACKTTVRTISPYSYYRLLPWYALYNSLQGCGFWTYSVPEGDAWDDFDGRWGDNCVIYNTESGIIGSRRWEAFLEGLDDYKLLVLAKESLAENYRRQICSLVLETPDDENGADKARHEILDALNKIYK